MVRQEYDDTRTYIILISHKNSIDAMMIRNEGSSSTLLVNGKNFFRKRREREKKVKRRKKELKDNNETKSERKISNQPRTKGPRDNREMISEVFDTTRYPHGCSTDEKVGWIDRRSACEC